MSFSVRAALNIAQTPLFLVPPALPIVMLDMPKDHHLYFEAFDDASDLDGDGIPEITYKHSFDYYGYFDSHKCYDYINDRFEPVSVTDNEKYCSGQWSGNFLNWASMTRIDTLRKILYGGFRSTDIASETVLERSYLPNDGHSFAKFYQGADLAQLTPFAAAESEGITLCNTTVSSAIFSQDASESPLLRVAKGNYSLWAADEHWQCQWYEDKPSPVFGGQDGINLPGVTLGNPKKADKGLGDYDVRVKVCASDALKGFENCKIYQDNKTGIISLKPIGLLQTYGDNGGMLFGLMTGSYGKSLSGGVLRKNTGPLTDEINVDMDGTFKSVSTDGGIINTLNQLRIYGYNQVKGTYACDAVDGSGGGTDSCHLTPTLGSDNCPRGLFGAFDNGECSNWGNPQSEIYLETLRYLAGQSASPIFKPDSSDSTRIKGLFEVDSTDPVAEKNYCAALNVVHLNVASSSYDADELSEVTDIHTNSAAALTDTVGIGEDIVGHLYSVGEVVGNDRNNRVCTTKTVTALSNVRGLCPDEPALLGSYMISGLAHYAHTNDLRPDRTGKQLVNTFGLTSFQNKPKWVINVPGSVDGKITLIPACRNVQIGGDCALVEFKVISRTVGADSESGKLYVSWDDSEQGSDFDRDMWGVIEYKVTSTQATITTDVIGVEPSDSPYPMGFGYIIDGTTKDGFHVHSGVNRFNQADIFGVEEANCSACDDIDSPTSVSYTIDNAAPNTELQTPLWYAAKWGGFIDGNGDAEPLEKTEWDAVDNVTGLPPGDGNPDQYYFSINPQQSEEALSRMLSEIGTRTVGTSTATTSNSSFIGSDTLIYLSRFNSDNWTGQLLAYRVSDKNGDISSTPEWDAGVTLTDQGEEGRRIFGYNPLLEQTKGIEFLHENLNAEQQALLTVDQVDFIRGDQSHETPKGAFRARHDSVDTTAANTTVIHNGLLGDIVNSSPVYIGLRDVGYEQLPDAEGQSYLDYAGSNGMLQRVPKLAVGANDGMLHVFDASLANKGKEIFAYVPHTVIANLAALTSPSYTAQGHHKYFVDGPVALGDAYFDADKDNDKEWRTVLLGALGAGGKGLFALDVSFLDPNDYNVPEPDFSAKRVLWEISDQIAPLGTDLLDDVTSNPPQDGFANNLGYTLGQASVVRMANGQFAAVFANGYESVNQGAVLYIVDVKDGSLIRSINTGANGGNGLSAPLAVDVNKDRIIDVIYAGDLLGHLWKFDVSSPNPNNWAVAYMASGAPAPLFTARSGTQSQPITVQPTYGVHPNGGLLLFFGTGSYFKADDNVVSDNLAFQSFYGVWDECVNSSGTNADPCTASPVGDRSNLVQQTLEAELTQNQSQVRKTSDNTVDYTQKKGWYLDLLIPPTPGVFSGERIITGALLHNRRIIFITFTPNTSCEAGGSSWIMELNPLTGGRLSVSPFDITGNGIINNDDKISDASNFVSVSGIKLDTGIVNGLTILQPPQFSGGGGEAIEYKYFGLEKKVESVPQNGFRQSWVQLR